MKRIPLTQNKFALVDDEDFEELSKYSWYAIWSETTRGFYAYNKQGSMTRFIMDCSSNMQIDHKNHDTLDNQKSNLRVCTVQENQYNSKSRKNSSSKYKGVYWFKRDKVWVARIKTIDIFDRLCTIYLGRSKNEKEAAQIYDKAARREHREFGRYNFPEEGEQSALL